MRALYGVSVLPGALDGHRHIAIGRTSPAAAMRKPAKTVRGLTVAKIDRLISVAGALVLALSALYFAPIVGSIFMK